MIPRLMFSPSFHLSFVICLTLLGTGQNDTFAADWRPLPYTKSNGMFESSSITRVSPSVMRVWFKCVIPKTILDEERKAGSADLYEDYAYTTMQLQIDCKEQTIGYMTILNHDSKGQLIKPTFSFEDIEMQPVIQDSESEVILSTVCDFANKNMNK